MKEKLLLFLVQNLVKSRGLVLTHVLGHCLHAAAENALTELYFDHVTDLQIIRRLDDAGIDHNVAFAAGIVCNRASFDNAGYF